MKTTKLSLTLTVAALLIPAQSDAVQLTFEMLATAEGSSPGVVISPDGLSAIALPGQVVGVDVVAVVHGTNGSNTDDGFLLTHGSFLSVGSALGDYSVAGNNVAPFNGGVSQPGVLANLDGDPDLELGRLATTGTPSPLPWFIATTGGTAAVMGTQVSGGLTAFRIGHTTYTLASNATGAVDLTYAPRIKTDGLGAAQQLHRFTLDNTLWSLRGTDPEIATTSLHIATPEPSAGIMVLLGSIGLMGFRRSTGRKSN